MGCCQSKGTKTTAWCKELTVLASGTPFTVSEVEALHELFKKLSSSVIGDGFISKEDLQFALFRNNNKKNLFANRMFDLFDVKCNGVIEFGEFVQSLGVFHPNAPVEEKIYCKVNISLDCNACRCTCTRPPSHTQTSSFFCISIWFLLVG
ncbi:hypothetical protein BDE02_15G011600 [Populus trichocarpa]|nr:hypothetical protein BDE02_15G011600 [Populus trichocarpa]